MFNEKVIYIQDNWRFQDSDMQDVLMGWSCRQLGLRNWEVCELRGLSWCCSELWEDMMDSLCCKEDNNQEMRELQRSPNVDEVKKHRRLRWLVKQLGWMLRVQGESEFFIGQCNVGGQDGQGTRLQRGTNNTQKVLVEKSF